MRIGERAEIGTPLRPVRVGVVGLGRVGIIHASVASAMPNVEIVGLADARSSARREARGVGFRAPMFDRVSTLIAKTSPEALIVAVPHDLRPRLVREALESKVAVLTGRPLSPQLPEAEALALLAQGNDTPLACMHALPFHPVFAEVRSMISAAPLGSIRRVRASSYRSLVFDPARQAAFAAEHAAGGVVAHEAMDALFYLIDCFGMPREVRATTLKLFGPLEDESHVMMTLPSGTGVGSTPAGASRLSVARDRDRVRRRQRPATGLGRRRRAGSARRARRVPQRTRAARPRGSATACALRRRWRGDVSDDGRVPRVGRGRRAAAPPRGAVGARSARARGDLHVGEPQRRGDSARRHAMTAPRLLLSLRSLSGPTLATRDRMLEIVARYREPESLAVTLAKAAAVPVDGVLTCATPMLRAALAELETEVPLFVMVPAMSEYERQELGPGLETAIAASRARVRGMAGLRVGWTELFHPKWAGGGDFVARMPVLVEAELAGLKRDALRGVVLDAWFTDLALAAGHAKFFESFARYVQRRCRAAAASRHATSARCSRGCASGA
jgi:predicted dehydrogenase